MLFTERLHQEIEKEEVRNCLRLVCYAMTSIFGFCKTVDAAISFGDAIGKLRTEEAFNKVNGPKEDSTEKT